MARLTDEEFEQLLRETFAEKEKLVDRLPQATSRRWLSPAVLAAAAVLVVLTGILYGVSRGGDPDPSPPVATAIASDDADVWAAAIVTIARRFEPADGWQALKLWPRGSGPMSPAEGAYQAGSPTDVATISPEDRERISQLVAVVAPTEWDDSAVSVVSCSARRVATVTVGAVVDKGDHKEVRTWIAPGCGAAYQVTYRVEQQDGGWTVTATVGAPSRDLTFDNGCATSPRLPASPRAGC